MTDHKLPPRIKINYVSIDTTTPHAFEPSGGSIRSYGAPMSNPPQPSDFVPDPYCKRCRRLRRDPVHFIAFRSPTASERAADIVSSSFDPHDHGDEDARR